MALSIQSNFSIRANAAASNMRHSQGLMSKNINHISSNNRAASPTDNIASYYGSIKIKNDAAGASVLYNSVQDNAAMLNVADAAQSSATDVLLELKSLKISYDTASNNDTKAAIKNAYDSLYTTLAAIDKEATYKGAAVAGSAVAVSLYLDTSATNKIAAKGSAAGGALATVAKNIDGLNINNIGTVTVADFSTALTNVANTRTALGGDISALEQISSYISDMTVAKEAAYSAITEADMAQEMTSYVSNSIQSQAAQAMIAQANQSLAQTLNLLQF
jgi:flagellin-like hook-associated protein FlgL